ncbi:MAG: histidine phosphatase family protein [Candidatus Saccharimonas sp.]
MTEIYLMRHAESTMQVQLSTTVGGRQNEIELTPRGLEQAARARDYLLRHNIHPTIRLASLAVRAVHTASIVLDTPIADIRQDWHFQEQTHGEAEGQPRDQIYTNETLHELAVQGMDFHFPGGESTNEVALRMIEGIIQEARAAGPNQVIFIGTHGIASKALLAYHLGYDQQWIYRTIANNCCLTKLLFDDDTLTVDKDFMLVDTLA